MKTPGFRIGQAANLAHEWLVATQDLDSITDLEFVKLWKVRTQFYIPTLTDMEKEFGDDEDWTDKKPEPKEIPIIVFDEDESTN